MSATPLPRRGWGRALAVFLLGSLGWTLLVCYPNPAVFFRNLARYHRLPIDPGIATRMDWAVPKRAADIETFVDGLLMPASDWRLYRVPWYVPTAQEAADVMRGDCEAKTILLASLLAGRKIPFEIRASFTHIWVDYAGRAERPGESPDTAYLQGKGGRLGVRLPRAVHLGECYAVEKQLLWDEMPPFRRAAWLLGLLWVALALLGRTAAPPQAEYVSRGRPSRFGYLVRTAAVASLLLLGLLSWPAGRRGMPSRWTPVDVWEAGALCAVLGAFLVWLFTRHLLHRRVSVSVEDESLIAYSVRGLWRRRRDLPAAGVRHLQLDATPSSGRPWQISAVLRDGRKAALLDFQDEIEARRVLRALGSRLARPIVTRVEGVETAIPAEEIGLSLRERKAALPRPDLPPRPQTLDLMIETGDGSWVLRYPRVERGMRWMLLAFALLPAGLFAFACWLVWDFTTSQVLWWVWRIAGALLCLTAFLVIVVKDEMVARLGAAKVEIAAGRLRFHRPGGRIEQVDLASIESVEFGRDETTPTLAIVSPDRVIHIAGLCTEEERAWVRDTVEAAILSADPVGAVKEAG